MSEVEIDLIRQYAEAATDRVVKKAIVLLRASKHTLSGEDSGLVNTWDEICVQVQGERTFFWDAYEEAMRDATLAGLFVIEERDKQSIWLQTEPGWQWIWDVENGRQPEREMPVTDEDLATHFAERLLAKAKIFTNSRIKAFLSQYCD